MHTLHDNSIQLVVNYICGIYLCLFNLKVALIITAIIIMTYFAKIPTWLMDQRITGYYSV